MAESNSLQESPESNNSDASNFSRLRLSLYLATITLVPLLLFVAAIFIVPTDYVAERSGNPFLVTEGYGGQLRNTQCDIAIYGDSTAMIGINPSIIQKRTGLATCNIAETEGMTMVNGTLIVDQFLQNNPRPRFLIFLYSPEGMDPESQRHNPEVTTFEAVMYRFRQPNKLKDLALVLKNPEDFFTWAEHGIRMAMSAPFSKPLPPDVRTQRFKTGGQSPLKNPPLTSCAYARHNTPPNKEWVASLRSKYAGNGTTVLVDAMMLPECDPDLDYFRQHLNGVIDNPIETMPKSDYFGGGRHANPAGSIVLSNRIADQVEARIQSQMQPKSSTTLNKGAN